MHKKNVYGIGINDSNYKTSITEQKNNKKIRLWVCPYYRTWVNMLQRCYSSNFHKKNPTYSDCIVCHDWLTFSNFKKWMESQDWQGKQLDKDIIDNGNNIYSPEKCCFVSHRVNSFLTDCGSKRGKYPIGVMFHKSKGVLIARCRNPFSKKQEHLGVFSCVSDAANAWKKRKAEISIQLSIEENNSRVSEALRRIAEKFTLSVDKQQ
jgi:hypothetical protein